MSMGLWARASPCFCAFPLIGIFVYAAVQLAAFTPLYTPVECHDLQSRLNPPVMDLAWINITGSMRRECKNPNPYSISISTRSVGRVFVKEGSELKPLGQSHVPDTELPAHDKGIGKSIMEIALPMTEATVLLTKPLLQVVSEVHLRSEARPKFFGITMSASEDKDEVCGFEVRIATQKVGPSRCAPTLEELIIPGVDAEHEVSFLRMNEDNLTKQELKKNAAFGSIMAISFLGIVGAVAIGAGRMRGQRKERDVSLKDDTQGSKEQKNDIV